MFKKSYITIVISIIASIMFAYFGDYSKSKVISYDFVLNMEVGLFSVSLAIVALIITILEKYKEKIGNDAHWANSSSSILKELCENTIGLLIIIIILILFSIINGMLSKTFKIDIMTVVLISCMIISLIVMFDTTWSIYQLVVNLKDILSLTDSQELDLSQKEIYLIDAYRFLDDERKKSFEELLKAMTTNQQVESKK